MNFYFLIAGILCFCLGIAHSVLGEYLIFTGKRIKGIFVPILLKVESQERHLGIIWATWHLASIFGCCNGAILVKIAMVRDTFNSDFIDFIMVLISSGMFATSLLVFMGTKGKHFGWIVLLIIGILILFGGWFQ